MVHHGFIMIYHGFMADHGFMVDHVASLILWFGVVLHNVSFFIG